MTQPTINELVERLRTATTIPEIAGLTARLLRECGVFNLQMVGLELARMSVTGGLGRN